MTSVPDPEPFIRRTPQTLYSYDQAILTWLTQLNNLGAEIEFERRPDLYSFYPNFYFPRYKLALCNTPHGRNANTRALQRERVYAQHGIRVFYFIEHEVVSGSAFNKILNELKP